MRSTRLWLLGALIAGAGLFQVATCSPGDSAPADEIVNYCVVFDCQNGAFGGLIDWCNSNFRAFNDCP